MNTHKSAWDEDYRRRGDLWGGAPPPLPDLPAGAAVLELGCGNGKTLAALIRQPWSVTAVDISPRAVSLARRRPGTAAANLVVADAACLPFRGEVFDAVFLVHVAGHLPETGRRNVASAVCRFRGEVFDAVFLVHVAGHLPETGRRNVASAVCRVLRPGGAAFFRAFSVEDMRAGKGVETEAQTFSRGNGIITHYFTETEVEELFAPLAPVSVRTRRWQMRIRGGDLPRAEIEAVFRKTG
ncbi:class I SAM-dependent methyltransferase [Methanoculleus bourgensis]|uniref:class I SAM-dependent methyltransferase n=1 Tax=Methanoculleus bourgensis TaxID=83986 RepID=UPI000A91EB40|nr:class I SAM-dependent methyltransferase [Methanoculleus bourgensis]